MMKSQTKAARNLVLYFQVHQPRRLNILNFFDIGSSGSYFNDEMNADIVRRVARECYIPTNNILINLLKKHPKLKITFSISGVALDQFESFAPEALKSFRQLIETGSVELLAETHYHSLASLMTGDEFEAQVMTHVEKLQEHFKIRPRFFRNTELLYDDEIGKRIAGMGFNGMITEGTDAIVKTPGVNHVYHHPVASHLKIMLRNYRLSDDISFRFRDFNVTADTFLQWLNEMPDNNDVITLGMDYETFGEHHKKESGIQKFLKNLLTKIARQRKYKLTNPSEVIQFTIPKGPLHIVDTISWADREKNVSAWLGNDMQRDAFNTVSRMEHTIKSLADTELLNQWRYLLTSDHFYYMSTKRDTDGKIHSYFSHYPSPYEAFVNFMNVITDFSIHTKKHTDFTVKPGSALSELERHKQIETVPTWAMTADKEMLRH